MNKLTPKLLGLVLGIKIIDMETTGNHIVYTPIDKRKWDTKLNLDTLGRLCKEWLSELYPNFSIKWANHKAIGMEDFQVRIWLNNVCIGKGKTELEAIIQATEWVAKEKGYYNE